MYSEIWKAFVRIIAIEKSIKYPYIFRYEVSLYLGFSETNSQTHSVTLLSIRFSLFFCYPLCYYVDYTYTVIRAL